MDPRQTHHAPVRTGVDSPLRRQQRTIGLWLLVVAGMVFAMVVLGGLTRLTESGLSMVEWRPVTGWLPPLTETGWQAEFQAYKAYPEYQKVNRGMSLEQFKEIYWLEYLHRLWGRLIGVAFALPFAVFLVRRWIDRRLGLRLAGLLVLGGLQGVLGWYMVKSGLVDRPDVSQYRLAAHLGLALVIYAYALWIAFGLLSAPHPAQTGARTGARRAFVVAGLVFVTMLSGAFVAGLDAGFAYNTFPLMDDELIPAALFAHDPVWRAPFEDITTVQFVHRLLAVVTLLAVLAVRLSLRGVALAPSVRRAADLLALWTVVQFGLGVATLLSFVALPLAALHQASALVLWTLALWTAFQLSGRGKPLAATRTARAMPGGAGEAASWAVLDLPRLTGAADAGRPKLME